jgi:signal transduction histidine kinase
MSASTPSQPPSRIHAWERWVKIWHAVFYLVLALPTLLYLLSDDARQSQGLVLGLTLALGLWYGGMMMWLVPRSQGNTQTVLALLFLVVGIVIWIPLAQAHPAYYLTATSFYGLMWGTLPFWMAIAGNVILTGVIIWLQSLSLDRPVIFSANLLVIGIVVIGWSVLLALYVRTIMRESAERKGLIEKLEAAQEELVKVERQAGVLEERQRMAQEIHDTLAQGFTSIVMLLEAADQALPEETASAQDYIDKARQTARASLGEARRLVAALQPQPLEKAPLPEALRREAARWTENSGIKSEYAVTGEPLSLYPETEVTLLRGMQEGLTNVYKHAEANLVIITLSYMAGQVALDIQDDGCGFEVGGAQATAGQKNGGFGLRSMQQRVEQIGGTVILESTPGRGTTLAIQIPIGNDVEGNG